MIKTAGFGGGCHWCTEAVFASLKGVKAVRQGWISSTGENDSWSEGVLVDFDTSEISFETLVEIHLYTHASTSEHSMRDKYRSAVYVFDAQDLNEVNSILGHLRSDFEGLVTKALPFVAFESSRDELVDYYYSDPNRPFCELYINPKLKLLLTRFASYANEAKIGTLE
ncbi:MAG: peptide methionine sulfoxide reductase [Flavobacterium sp.]|uniref:peptide-methionine (S)-S-oxide reductase n=1 Tax=Flavobacterium sp. TaxID=239 RepID=UPI001227BC62|nr:peptide-methionine (S)-S-oxide reductase [Flavobacterium sp.]RZJ65585.1 MAG: peptide methionine sulfoxide reductase [Flavobacterium sp.]